jgi:hypothetical protein
LSILLLFIGISQGCKQTGSSTSDPNAEETVIDTLPDDFVKFFRLFHEDSAYQLEHINFPLVGLPHYVQDKDTLMTQRYFWQKTDWIKHNRFTDPGGNFEQWYVVMNDRIIEHVVHMKGTNMYIKRRFAKLNDGWYLIYYQGMRPGAE